MMAPFRVLVTLMMIFMASFNSLSLAFDQLKQDIHLVTISAAPAILPAPSLSPPFTEISPDISPLLPSPGGELPAPVGSDIPTIPSNPSPPNPDQVASVGPDFALSPTGSELISAASYGKLSWFINFAFFLGLVLYWC